MKLKPTIQLDRNNGKKGNPKARYENKEGEIEILRKKNGGGGRAILKARYKEMEERERERASTTTHQQLALFIDEPNPNEKEKKLQILEQSIELGPSSKTQ